MREFVKHRKARHGGLSCFFAPRRRPGRGKISLTTRNGPEDRRARKTPAWRPAPRAPATGKGQAAGAAENAGDGRAGDTIAGTRQLNYVYVLVIIAGPGGERMIRKALYAAVALAIATGAAMADPIEGAWTTEAGSTARIAACGDGLCITLRTGPHAGKRIGTFQPAGGGKYTGRITDPSNDKTYTGKGTLSGDSLKLGGCVLGGLICRNQTWTRR